MFGKLLFSRLIFSKSLLLLLFFLSHTSSGATSNIESLKKQLAEHNQRDTTAVNLLNEIGYKYWIVDANESILYGERALSLARELSFAHGMARANRVVGVAYWSQGIQNLALSYLKNSIKQYKNLNDKIGIANVTLNIGMVYADLKDYNKALYCYESAINDFTSLGLKDRIATSFTKMGVVLIEQQKEQEALRYLSDALSMHTDNNYRYGIAEVHRKLGTLYLNLNELEQASYHTRKSIAIGKPLNDNHGLAHNYIILGKVLRLSNQIDSSNYYVESGLALAQVNDIKQFELLAYEELKELRKTQGKPYEALEFYKQYALLKDTLMDLEKSKQIAFLEYENELDKKDAELKKAQDQEKSSRKINLLLVFGVVVLLIAAYLIYRISKQRIKKGKELAIKSKEHLESVQQLIQKDLENSELKRKELNHKLDFKNRELTAYALNFIKKNEVVKELQQTIKELNESNHFDKDRLIIDLRRILKKNLSIDKDWEDFSRFFDDVHGGFYSKLKQQHPSLTTNDLKLCSLIRLNLNAKEIANILGISPESAKTSRYRLRKKLALGGETEISDYLIGIS